MINIKFGTDGWRAIIAKEYTLDNVCRVADASARWLKNNGGSKVVIGHDCRFGGAMFAIYTARVFAKHGIRVNLAKGVVSTPMVSLGVVQTKSDLGIVITASHNPPEYNGYKLKSHRGGPSFPSDIAEVEALIEDTVPTDLPEPGDMHDNGLLAYIDLESMYCNHVEKNFDMNAIRNMGQSIGYDAMYGAGQHVFQKLIPTATVLHCEENPSFYNQAPEPIHRNLMEFSKVMGESENLKVGIANDGDADRIGMYDENGKFVDSHHILLLLLKYLYKHKNLTGTVVTTFSVTGKMKKLSEAYGLPHEVTKIGFKYIAEIMANKDVLVGGEESGGLAVKGHIPERDGIWIGLVILEYMAKTNQTLCELIDDLYKDVGSFAFDRDDLHVSDEQKANVISNCNNDSYQNFGDYSIDRIERIDGTKFILGDDKWVMIRPSGTEPVLRVYCEAPTPKEVRTILDATKETILS